MPFLLLVAVAAAYMGMLNALRRFFMPAMSPALLQRRLHRVHVVLVPVFTRLGIAPVMALSVGMLLGGVAQIVAQWPVLRREGYRHQWILNPRDPSLREVLILMGPGTLGVAAAQINLFVNTSLATGAGRRRLGARLRVPVDVHADWHLRRLGGDGGDSGPGTPRGRRVASTTCGRRSRGAFG